MLTGAKANERSVLAERASAFIDVGDGADRHAGVPVDILHAACRHRLASALEDDSP